jgi:hypothetical protein
VQFQPKNLKCRFLLRFQIFSKIFDKNGSNLDKTGASLAKTGTSLDKTGTSLDKTGAGFDESGSFLVIRQSLLLSP